MSTSLLTAFQPLITAVTPSLANGVLALLAVVMLVCVVGLSDTLTRFILIFVRGPDHRAGWSDDKKAAYGKYKDRYDFKRELDRETRSEIRREKKRWS